MTVGGFVSVINGSTAVRSSLELNRASPWRNVARGVSTWSPTRGEVGKAGGGAHVRASPPTPCIGPARFLF
ncbi:hypothetical protein GN958_ATG12702 [Phytophthora infestans]|uniref:Uncharacterized protein n=1 Tax=Phytophthora infestans TaxID=4787 RepID=A0A8S9UC60_PHYIN|nr:hypothetical protein GN958_ATG12702 [Phytophthora infestans]